MAEDRADQKGMPLGWHPLRTSNPEVAQKQPEPWLRDGDTREQALEREWRLADQRALHAVELLGSSEERLERDQALLAKEQRRWWPKLWQAVLAFWALALVWSAVWFLVNLSEGNWTGTIASALLWVCLVMGPIKERRGPRDPS